MVDFSAVCRLHSFTARFLAAKPPEGEVLLPFQVCQAQGVVVVEGRRGLTIGSIKNVVNFSGVKY